MKKILITGGNGLCGSALKRLSNQQLYSYHFVGREYGDLTILNNIKSMYDDIRPDYVIHTAAEVGGIGGNEAHHGEFFYNNVLMNAYMIDQARLHNVEKMIVFSSVCVFPDGQLLQEDNMHDGPVFSSNFAYGHAKRMVDIQIQAYQKQYGIKNYCSVIPGNIFGPQDSYNIEFGHVIPSLIHKIFLAKYDNKINKIGDSLQETLDNISNDNDFVVWGDGSAKREFIYVDDLARIIYKLLELDELPLRLIVSGPKQYTIKKMVKKLVKIANFNGKVVWDKSKPNGQHARPSDLSLLYSLFPDFEFTDIDEALTLSYDWFFENCLKARK